MKKIFILFALLMGVSIFPALVQAQSKKIEIKTTFTKWQAMSGPLEGRIFTAKEQNEEKASTVNTVQPNNAWSPNVNIGDFSKPFNAKVWKGDSNFPLLAIVTLDVAPNHTGVVIADNNFRFDQVTNKKKERYRVENKSKETVFINIGNENVMLATDGYSYRMDDYMGWYYLEMSVKINGKIVPFDIIKAVALGQREIVITDEDLPRGR